VSRCVSAEARGEPPNYVYNNPIGNVRIYGRSSRLGDDGRREERVVVTYVLVRLDRGDVIKFAWARCFWVELPTAGQGKRLARGQTQTDRQTGVELS
jgi:hypothetical protein